MTQGKKKKKMTKFLISHLLEIIRTRGLKVVMVIYCSLGFCPNHKDELRKVDMLLK